jgi:hypothetical protein
MAVDLQAPALDLGERVVARLRGADEQLDGLLELGARARRLLGARVAVDRDRRLARGDRVDLRALALVDQPALRREQAQARVGTRLGADRRARRGDVGRLLALRAAAGDREDQQECCGEAGQTADATT